MCEVKEGQKKDSREGNTNFMTEAPCTPNRITQSSPMLSDVHGHPNQMGKWDNKIRKREVPGNWICLKHMERQPEPDVVNSHCLYSVGKHFPALDERRINELDNVRSPFHQL
mmetsp:Transcript_26245/g.39023  ORF Transcript_26245/g.39023 Transcript_26245/m.39023 type:complete len:112 (+) Transcript_26245:491-826(+)